MATEIEPFLLSLPETLRDRVAAHWQAFHEAGGEVPETVLDELARVWAGSDFVAQACSRAPALLAELVQSGDLETAYGEGAYAQRLSARLQEVTDEEGLGVALRRFRRREMVRIIWRDLAGRAPLEAVTAELSALADACIDQALARLDSWQRPEMGEPTGPDGTPQHLVVLGMGKLGAGELNLSSDVDLILAYPEEGETVGGRRSYSNQEYFVRLGRRLVDALNKTTAEGFVFRTDLRLRPFGESAPVAVNFDAMEHYYQTHGREWERYAMVKARVVAGDREAGARLMETLHPFVYRRYIDFGAFESLREMKGLIEKEVRRKGLEDNVKLGRGGIREVEFIAQAFQLIRGGREPALQERALLPVLEALREMEFLPGYVVDELLTAYRLLRRTEHRIQAFADRQSHTLPAEEEGRVRLAFTLGYEDWEACAAELAEQREKVHSHFEQVFAAPQKEHADSDELDLDGIWRGVADDETAQAALAELGFTDPAKALERLRALHQARSYQSLSRQGRERMDRLMPLLIGAVAGADEPDTTLPRLLDLVEHVARRTAYLALLVENPMALSQLVRLTAASSWVTTHLARHPQLLDELLDPRSLYAPPDKAALQKELRTRLGALPADDLEAQMDALRHFKQSNLLRVAAADIVEAVPLMEVSDHLTWIAEVVVDEVLDLAWRDLVARHGRPYCHGDEVCDTGFAVIAYGKLGGYELGYGSDLDMVFIHASEQEDRETSGEKPVPTAVFFARLAQRIIHILTARTPAGVLYEADLRLRPSGASGLLVSSTEAFEQYQREKAWTWEHQALVRARVVAGDPGIGEAFLGIRRETLGRQRELGTLRTEVREMRERMRKELAKGGADAFDLKQDPGGIADIEFVVQYGVLAWAPAHPVLLGPTDNLRLLEAFASEGLMPQADAQALADAYRAYRAEVHRLALQERSAVAAADAFAEEREAVQRIWRGLMEAAG